MISRRKILFILPSFAGGGAERVVLNLLIGLDRTGLAPALLVLDGRGPLRTQVPDHVHVIDLKTPKLRHAIGALYRQLRTGRIEVVVTSLAYLNITLLLMKPTLPDVRIILREANMPSASLASGHWPVWMRPLYRLALHFADAVIASSEAMKREMIDVLGAPRDLVYVLYNPVDVDVLRQRAASPVRAAGLGRRFVAVGRLVRQKGFDRLIGWMAEMEAEDRLDILGEGPERATLEVLIAESGLGERVRLCGFMLDPAPLVAGADALLLPSRWEGMPNAALEALAVGTPVVATDTAGAIAEVAAAAPVGAVTVVRSNDFTAAMRAVAPAPPMVLHASLLPKAFEKVTVAAEFEALVCDVLNGVSACTGEA